MSMNQDAPAVAAVGRKAVMAEALENDNSLPLSLVGLL
jgi:hypothetical protein